ncbi:MAG: helix-turn-helix transcriptional regulator [Lachnospiraceae bacterium]|nr:helix-turn-helix transcriptional regulator [Lachnospiraceae bacterium]
MKELKEETLGQRIRAQRIRIGMTQDELAEKLLIPKASISAYENDRIDIKGSRIVELATALEVTPNYLLGFSEEENQVLEDIVRAIKEIKDPSVLNILKIQIEALANV